MKDPVIVSEKEIDGAIDLEVEEYEDSIRLVMAHGGRSVVPVFLRSYLPDNRFMVGIGSRSPFFFESMLREAEIEFMYDEIEQPPATDRSYASMACCSLDADEVHEMICQFNRISSVAMYDFWFQPDGEQLWFGEGAWIACHQDNDAVRDAATVFVDEH